MRYLLAVATFVTLTGTGFTAEPQKELIKKADHPENHLKSAKSSILAALSFANWEYYSNLTIPANGSIFLDSMTDFSSATGLEITVRSAGSDIGNLAIVSSWSVPGAASFNVGTVALGNSFFFNNTGGASFSVSGAQLRTFLYNTGPTAMTLSSVIVYTPGQ